MFGVSERFYLRWKVSCRRFDAVLYHFNFQHFYISCSLHYSSLICWQFILNSFWTVFSLNLHALSIIYSLTILFLRNTLDRIPVSEKLRYCRSYAEIKLCETHRFVARYVEESMRVFWTVSAYVAISVVKSRWLRYFLESRSICQKFYFLESKSSFKIFYFLYSRQ